jgi:hypothetical protein
VTCVTGVSLYNQAGHTGKGTKQILYQCNQFGHYGSQALKISENFRKSQVTGGLSKSVPDTVILSQLKKIVSKLFCSKFAQIWTNFSFLSEIFLRVTGHKWPVRKVTFGHRCHGSHPRSNCLCWYSNISIVL